jgi:cation transport regulator
MPYREMADLPDSVKKHLPPHAREIYLAAFNNAWKEYAARVDRESVAHRVAWAAVKKQYRKTKKEWTRK